MSLSSEDLNAKSTEQPLQFLQKKCFISSENEKIIYDRIYFTDLNTITCMKRLYIRKIFPLIGSEEILYSQAIVIYIFLVPTKKIRKTSGLRQLYNKTHITCISFENIVLRSACY